MVRQTAVLVLALLFPALSRATTSTIGGGASPYRAPLGCSTLSCFSVKLTTTNPTLVLAADPTRCSLYLINVSSTDLTGSGTGQHPPSVYITSTTTSNLGTSPLPASLPRMNALQIQSCNPETLAGQKSGCRWEPSNYQGAVYAISESSGVASYDPLTYVQGCVTKP